MGSLLEMTASIVGAHAKKTAMNSADLLQELKKVHASLQQLEESGVIETTSAKPAMSLKQAFKADQVCCMVCGKGGMKTLTRHLAQSHSLKPGAYRKQFGIPSSQALTARVFSEARRAMAQEKGLADNLAKARAVRAANLTARKGTAQGKQKRAMAA
jgi:predicted transcriptional regulator